MKLENVSGSVMNLQASKAEGVTKSDTTVVSYHGLWVGTTGDVAVKFRSNPSDVVIFKNIPSGTLLPIIDVIRVMSTDTDASDIVGFLK